MGKYKRNKIDKKMKNKKTSENKLKIYIDSQLIYIYIIIIGSKHIYYTFIKKVIYNKYIFTTKMAT